MKNYIFEAKKANVNIYSAKYIQKYKIHKDAKYVEVFYMNGDYDTKYLDDTTEQELEKRQREGLKDIEKEVKEKTNLDVKVGSSISGTYFTVGTILAFLNYSSFPVWYTWAGYFLFKAVRPLKLRKDIALTGWIHDNKEKVNEVIRDEVDSKREQITDNVSTNNIVLGKYPIDKVPYSEEIYEDGINLNNIDELSYKELKKLKRKVLKREKKK